MMIANVTHYRDFDGDIFTAVMSRGTVRGLGDSDTYVFDLAPLSRFSLHGVQGTPSTRWEFRGKVHHDVFIPSDVTGHEHIPQEFYAALDQAYVTNSPVEFVDPFLDDLAVQGA